VAMHTAGKDSGARRQQHTEQAQEQRKPANHNG
jgi:hypothetical protein